MKLYSKDLKNTVQKLSNNSIKSILFHGPNQGFIKTALDFCKKQLDTEITNIDFKQLTASKLDLIINSKNFFNKKDLICVKNISGVINKDLKSALLNIENPENFIIFLGPESMPPSGVRKFFEDTANLASIGCYFDNEETISKIILQQSKKNNQTIEEEALFYLKMHLKGDHQIIKSELEKIFNFTNDKQLITKQHILQCLSSDLTASGDNLCLYFASQDSCRLIKEIAKLKEQGKNEVLMIRALIRYFVNIYCVCSKIESGINTDIAIKTLKPPIFFKQIPEFKRILKKYSSHECTKILFHLQLAEKNYKNNAAGFDLFDIYNKVLNI